MKTNSSNGQLTAQVNLGNHDKSGFDLSNNVLGTGKIGRIIPTRALHVMPGDTIKADSKVAVQFEPLAVPILANMDVKQEHFYVPYNVVWKNWDKFISGGEKMDYQGVVPNVTIQYIIDTIGQYFRMADISMLQLQVPDENYEDYPNGFAFSIGNDELTSLKQTLDTLGDAFMIRDILQPQYKVHDMLLDHLITTDSTFDTSYDFVLVELQGSENTYSNREITIENYLYTFGLKGNKYMEEIKPLLIDQLEYNRLVVPTAKGVALMDYFYEYVKPFIGLGSNIDYLNMGRITFADFLALHILNYTHMFAQGDETYPLMNVAAYASSNPLSILNLRANYNIWYNNYRDILLEADAFEPYDGDNISADELFVLLVPRQRCWEKDAFTTALDNPGTGSVGVPVTRESNPQMSVTKINQIDGDTMAMKAGNDDMEIAEITFNGKKWSIPTAFLSGQTPIEDHTVDFNGFSLHALDAAQRAQKWLQKALYFGNRISDFYYMRFGVRFLDARLRLPELLTSSSELVKLDVVMNNTNITTEANGEIFQSVAGDRAAYASAYDNGNSFDRYCEEHGVIMSYLTIMPQITYAYGINRDYSRLDQFDFAFAEFATLGMDAVYDTEITASSLAKEYGSGASKVFGYQGRYYDYKAKHSEEHGELLDSQDMYTFARHFNMYDKDGRPKLNYEFVHCFPSLDMFVVDSPLADYFRYDIRHSTAAERQLPSQSIYI